jgi:hypothetical protein
MATYSVGVTIVVEHVFVGFIGPMDETIVKLTCHSLNIAKIQSGVLTLSDGKLKT